MSNILGLDIGEKRIGIAISDESQTVARPLSILDNKENIFDLLRKVCKDNKVSLVVVGRPRNMDGSLGFQAEYIRKFTQDCFEKADISFTFEDETGTSKLAEQKMRKQGRNINEIKRKSDSYAATIILQGYLDELKA